MYTESGEYWNGLSTAWQFHVFSHRFVSSYSPENPTHPCRSPACLPEPAHTWYNCATSSKATTTSTPSFFQQQLPTFPKSCVGRSVCLLFCTSLPLPASTICHSRDSPRINGNLVIFAQPNYNTVWWSPELVCVCCSRRIGTKPISKCLSLAGWSHFFSVLSTDAVWLQFVRITRFNDWLVVVL